MEFSVKFALPTKSARLSERMVFRWSWAREDRTARTSGTKRAKSAGEASFRRQTRTVFPSFARPFNVATNESSETDGAKTVTDREDPRTNAAIFLRASSGARYMRLGTGHANGDERKSDSKTERRNAAVSASFPNTKISRFFSNVDFV